jgi:hypothetical protein
MKRIAGLLLLLLLYPAYLAAQNIEGGGVVISPNTTVVVASASYSGPADVVGATPLGFWGLRAMSGTYASGAGKLIKVTLLTNSHTCDILSATTGKLGNTANCSTGGDNATLWSTFCSTNCTVNTLYDQSGNALDMPTGNQEALLVPNSIGSTLPTMSCVVNHGDWYKNTTGISQAQGFFISYVSRRDANFTTQARGIFASNSLSTYTGYGASANQIEFNAGSNVDLTASDSVFHAYQSNWNNASSDVMIDGSANTGLSFSTGGLTGTMSICGNVFAAALDGSINELGIWSGTKSGTIETNLNTNQHGAANGWNF